jgi:hypothetical protein
MLEGNGLPLTGVNTPLLSIENAAIRLEPVPAVAYKNLLCPSVAMIRGLTPGVGNGDPTAVSDASAFTVNTDTCCPTVSPTNNKLSEALAAMESPPATVYGVPTDVKFPVAGSILYANSVPSDEETYSMVLFTISIPVGKFGRTGGRKAPIEMKVLAALGSSFCNAIPGEVPVIVKSTK